MTLGWVRRETHRTFKFRRRAGTVVTASEESYVRNDIRCGASDLCGVCSTTLPRLNSALRYFVIPDADALRDYLDVFELPELKDNVIILTSVARRLTDGNIRRSAQLRALYRDRRRPCVLFDNLHRAETAPQSIKELHFGGDLLAAASWYDEHLSHDGTTQRPSIVFLLVSDTLAAREGCSLDAQHSLGYYESLTPGLHVVTTKQYFEGRWGHVPSISTAFETLDELHTSKNARASKEAALSAFSRPHWSLEEVARGLELGTLIRGTLCVSIRDVQMATVTPIGGNARVSVQIVGKEAMIRAMHGDIVAVRVLPSGQWKERQDVAVERDATATELGSGFMAGPADDVAEAGVTSEQGGELPRTAETFVKQGPQPTGEVVAVIQRSSQEIVASLSSADEAAVAQLTGRDATGAATIAVLCVPLDRRLPRMRLRTRRVQSFVGQRLVIRLVGWEPGSNYPDAHVLRVLGPVGDLHAETDAVLASSGIRWQPFTEAAMRELPSCDGADGAWVVPGAVAAAEVHSGRRRDLRGEEYFIVSVDPPNCTDVDDAFHVRFLSGPEEGLVEVGVHIADVSWFVRENSALDAEAAARCTTVYLVDRRLDMLPSTISEDAASLRAGRDRFAVSVTFTLETTPPFEPVRDPEFGRTLIRSRHQLEYSQAQRIMATGGGDGSLSKTDTARLVPALTFLTKLADTLREKRLRSGALELESAELRFQTGTDGQPSSVTIKKELPMMRTVAELMIAANAAVAERIYSAFPRSALLRRHDPPRTRGLEELAEVCKAAGVPLDPNVATNAGQILGHVLRAKCEAVTGSVATLIRASATRCMSEAQYFCPGSDEVSAMAMGGLCHFGLALPLYTHFTSPIRRYADVVVHRQLMAALEQQQSDSGSLISPSEVASRAAIMNERHRAAKRAQKSCADLFLLLLLHQQPRVETAIVWSCHQTAVRVFIPKFHSKGMIHLVDKDGVVLPPLTLDEINKKQEREESLLARKQLALVHGRANTEGSESFDWVQIQDATTGVVLFELQTMQEVKVLMSGDLSRSHGPSLRLSLVSGGAALAVEASMQPAFDGIDNLKASGVKAAPPGFPQPLKARKEYPLRDKVEQLQGSFESLGISSGGKATHRNETAVTVVARKDDGDDGSKKILSSIDIGEQPARKEVDIPFPWGGGSEVPSAHRLFDAINKLRGKAARYELRGTMYDPLSERAVRWANRAALCRAQADKAMNYLKREAASKGRFA